jgi:hypothetical protein
MHLVFLAFLFLVRHNGVHLAKDGGRFLAHFLCKRRCGNIGVFHVAFAMEKDAAFRIHCSLAETAVSTLLLAILASYKLDFAQRTREPRWALAIVALQWLL